LATVTLDISALHEFWVHHYDTTSCHWSVMNIFNDSRILAFGYFESNLQCVVVLVQYSFLKAAASGIHLFRYISHMAGWNYL
jgi:hypothetical protein